MGKLLSGIFGWIGWKAVTLLLILAVLVAGAWIKGELKKADELVLERARLVATAESFVSRIQVVKLNVSKQIEAAKSSANFLESKLNQLRLVRQQVWDAHPVKRKLPLSAVWNQIKSLDLQIAAVGLSLNKVNQLNASTEKQLKELELQIEHRVSQFNGRITDIDETILKGYGQRVATVVYHELPIALGVLAGIILMPMGIKCVFYFIIAPWATGRNPIRILPLASGNIYSSTVSKNSESDKGKISAVSQSVVLGENQELIIQPEYLQSTSLRTKKETKWLLNAKFPFASVLSGMFMLTRIRASGTDPVVISATKDALSEVGIIDLPTGAAFVCQPRALVGVIQDRNNPIRITRHWRLGSLQSWLTLQLRFLAFHGPGQLVMKGCRGIRIESAGAGRLINQAATMGFSANIEYGNTRCETFVSYWTGKEDLFNDFFTGESGVYVYEEMPDLNRATGITGRGLEGFTDAVLKVFGV